MKAIQFKIFGGPEELGMLKKDNMDDLQYLAGLVSNQ